MVDIAEGIIPEECRHRKPEFKSGNWVKRFFTCFVPCISFG
jgi:hypothetical protein